MCEFLRHFPFEATLVVRVYPRENEAHCDARVIKGYDFYQSLAMQIVGGSLKYIRVELTIQAHLSQARNLGERKVPTWVVARAPSWCWLSHC